MARWLGADVGGKRKGFDVALIDEHGLSLLRSGLHREDVIELVDSALPAVVAIDSPRRCANDGESSRPGERQLARAICGIRWTPDASRVRTNSYYEWVVEGLALYETLAQREVDVIEVFPTASWTRWYGTRNGRHRSTWTEHALAAMGLTGVPARTNQDERDAIAAAITARQHSLGLTETMGEIVVPLACAQSGCKSRRTQLAVSAETSGSC